MAADPVTKKETNHQGRARHEERPRDVGREVASGGKQRQRHDTE